MTEEERKRRDIIRERLRKRGVDLEKADSDLEEIIDHDSFSESGSVHLQYPHLTVTTKSLRRRFRKVYA